MNQRYFHPLKTVLRLAGLVPIAVTFFILTTPTAQAFVSQGHVWAGAGAANLGHAAPSAFGWWGPSIETGLVVDVSDFWRLTADIGASHHFATTDDDDEPIGPHTVVSGALGVRYALDIAIYVPYVGLAVAAHPLGPPSSASPNGEFLSFRGTIGLDYRKSRRISLGAAADLHAPMTEPSDFPHYSSIRLHIAYHFQRF